MSRILATMAALGAGLVLAAAPAVRAVEPGTPAGTAAPADPLASDWLGAPLLPMPGEAATCRVDEPAARAARADTAAQLARGRALRAAEAAAAPDGAGDVVVLNNRGYNYRAGAAVVDPSLIEFEARHAR